MPVTFGIERVFASARRVARDHHADAPCAQALTQIGGIVSGVGHHMGAAHLREQLLYVGNVAHLPRGESESSQLTQTLHQGVDLGTQPAARAPERLRAVFFGAPLECWCARTIVVSRYTSRNCASAARTRNTRCQTPVSDQRANRRNMLFQGPNSSGRSRQGEPVRAIQSTASTKTRLSAAVRPGSLALPGSRSRIRAHCSSRSHIRAILIPPKNQDVNRKPAKLTAPRLTPSLIVHRT